MSHDLSLLDQAWIVLAIMVTAVLSMLAGVAIEAADREERARQREIEAEAHKYAMLGKRASK